MSRCSSLRSSRAQSFHYPKAHAQPVVTSELAFSTARPRATTGLTAIHSTQPNEIAIELSTEQANHGRTPLLGSEQARLAAQHDARSPSDHSSQLDLSLAHHASPRRWLRRLSPRQPRSHSTALCHAPYALHPRVMRPCAYGMAPYAAT